LTNGCLSTCDEETVLYKRTTETKCAGIIVKVGNAYTLYKAERIMLNTSSYHLREGSHPFGTKFTRDNDYLKIGNVEKRTGETVYVLPTAATFTTTVGRPPGRTVDTGLRGVAELSAAPVKDQNYKQGVLFLGEKFQRKHHDSVFVKGRELGDVTADYKNLQMVWTLYQSKQGTIKGVNEGDGTYSDYLSSIDKYGVLPVFYAKKPGGGYYLSPACISKDVFANQIKNILEAQGHYNPCSDTEKLCEACALFGMANENSAVASRIMFRDAVPDPEPASGDYAGWYEEECEMPILGGPKITATEFYMAAPDANCAYFTYDYKVGYSGGRTTRTPISPRLRGRKFYWHSSKPVANPETPFNAALQIKARAVKPHMRFKFSIAFDRVTMGELQKLKFALELTFGKDSNTVYAHKMGHGKPVGYGSVKIAADKIFAYELDGCLTLTERELSEVFYDFSPMKDKTAFKELRKISNFTNAPENIAYPSAIDRNGNRGNYVWFGLNKSTEERSFTKPHFSNVLPSILSDSVELPDTFRRGGGNRKSVAATNERGN
jgi:CRISPR-associated protein (TIGR03986 family)